MPILNNLTLESLRTLHRDYNRLSRFNQLSFPRAVRIALEAFALNDTSENAFRIYTAFFNTWGFQRRLFSCLREFSLSPITRLLHVLHTNHLLMGEIGRATFNVVVVEEEDGVRNHLLLMEMFHGLHSDGLLTGPMAQAAFNAASGHREPSEVALALLGLHLGGLLTGEGATANRNAVTSHRHPRAVEEALYILHRRGLLTGDNAEANRNAIIRHEDTPNLALALRKLSSNGLLTRESAQANFNTIKEHRCPERGAEALFILQQNALLTGDSADANRNVLARHPYPEQIAHALIGLRDLLAGSCGQLIRSILIEYQRDPNFHIDDLRSLHATGLLTGEDAAANCRLLLQCRQPFSEIARALVSLHEKGLLTGDGAEANRRAVAEYRGGPPPQTHFEFTLALIKLHEAGLLTASNRDAIANHAKPYPLAYALSTLHEKGLLTEANRSRVLTLRHPGITVIIDVCGLLTGPSAQINFNVAAECDRVKSLARALAALHANHLLADPAITQTRFDLLLLHSAVVLTPEQEEEHLWHENEDIWLRIPPGGLTSERFDQIIHIAETHVANPTMGRAALHAYVNHEILGFGDGAGAGAGAGAALHYDTHTASVHASASESARKLMAHYGSSISGPSLDATLLSVSTWLDEQPTSPRIDAAKRGFARITRSDYFHTDAVSDVSTKQLLALIWIAIQDDSKRVGTLDDAKRQMISALYESQREYNISEAGVDDGAIVDQPSCNAGTFNKLVEKFHALHPDINLVIINQAGATAKLHALVKEEALAYLNSLRTTGQTAELSRLLDAITATTNEDTVEPLWSSISESVANKLFEEFKTLYHNNRESAEFLGLIATGIFVKLPVDRLSALRPSPSPLATLTAGPGFFAGALPPSSEVNASATVATATTGGT
jgi:hypothetical protein